MEIASFPAYIANHMISLRSLYFLLLGIIAAFIVKHQYRYGQVVYFFGLIVSPILAILILDVTINYWDDL